MSGFIGFGRYELHPEFDEATWKMIVANAVNLLRREKWRVVVTVECMLFLDDSGKVLIEYNRTLEGSIFYTGMMAIKIED